MHHTLADEQISNANRYLKMVSGASLSAAEMNKLATHLQIAPPQLSGDVVRDMISAYREAVGTTPVFGDEPVGMSAAAQVLLDRVCAVISNKLMDDYHFSRKHATAVGAEVCNSLLKPAEPTQREKLIEILQLWSPSLVHTPLSEVVDDIETLFLHPGSSHDR